jgi:hypothetical protein
VPNIKNMRLEFRIPISPTSGFYSQVRLFEFALRRLGLPYSEANLLVCVGDNCDIELVKRENAWSADRIQWETVPNEVFDEFGIHGTADWRLIPPAREVDLIILCDADTVLLRDIDPLLAAFPTDRPALRGHMAHLPPPASGGGLPDPSSAHFWPKLFEHFGVSEPDRLFDYSLDGAKRLPQVPAYFNLGFVVLNPGAMTILGSIIFDFQRMFIRTVDSHMRCQIALTILAYKEELDIDVLPAMYNAANDVAHLNRNYLSSEDIRVLHYLRNDEIDRNLVLQEKYIDNFLTRELHNPANQLLQTVARAALTSWRTAVAIP